MPAYWGRYVIFAAMAAVWGWGTVGCKRQAPNNQAPPPPAVTVAPVEQRSLVDWHEFTGRTEAVEFVEVRPRVSGHIREVRFKAGQLVKKGDVLFVIDPRWADAEVARREAELAQAKVRLENVRREASRTKQLLETKAISAEEGESREARFREAEAGLRASEAALEVARLDLELTEIKSPIDGKVGRELVTAGNYVSGLAGGATILTTIVSVDPIFVYADVDENSYLKFSGLMREKKMALDEKGRIPVELQLADEAGFELRGHVESFDNRVDASMGSIVMRAVFPNKDGRILPGLFARVRIPGSAEYPALLISEEAIGTDQNQKYVLTVTPTNTVQYRAVKLGPSHAGKRVVREGLEPGEQIVVNGMARVRPGMAVVAQPVGPGKDSKPTNTAAARTSH